MLWGFIITGEKEMKDKIKAEIEIIKKQKQYIYQSDGRIMAFEKCLKWAEETKDKIIKKINSLNYLEILDFYEINMDKRIYCNTNEDKEIKKVLTELIEKAFHESPQTKPSSKNSEKKK